jgi:hypothetical protein
MLHLVSIFGGGVALLEDEYLSELKTPRAVRERPEFLKRAALPVAPCSSTRGSCPTTGRCGQAGLVNWC